MQEHDFKSIHIFVEPKNVILAMPTGLWPKFDLIAGLDILNVLEPPYSNCDIEKLIFKTFKQCYTAEVDDTKKPEAMLKHFKTKSYSVVYRRLKSISMDWNREEGYSIRPSQQVKKDHYTILDDKKRILGHNPKEGEIAEALRQAIEESTAL